MTTERMSLENAEYVLDIYRDREHAEECNGLEMYDEAYEVYYEAHMGTDEPVAVSTGNKIEIFI